MGKYRPLFVFREFGPNILFAAFLFWIRVLGRTEDGHRMTNHIAVEV